MSLSFMVNRCVKKNINMEAVVCTIEENTCIESLKICGCIIVSFYQFGVVVFFFIAEPWLSYT